MKSKVVTGFTSEQTLQQLFQFQVFTYSWLDLLVFKGRGRIPLTNIFSQDYETGKKKGYGAGISEHMHTEHIH